MRRLSAVMLCISLLILSAGCGGMRPVWVRDAVISFDRQTEAAALGIENGLLAEDKKYDYQAGNIVIMQVTNQTDRVIDLTIHMAYQNEEGRTIYKEDKEFSGFPAGWQNYFVFHPIIAFADYAYTLTAQPHEGETHTNCITFEHRGDKFGVLRLGPSPVDEETILTDAAVTFVPSGSCDRLLYWSADFVWFDNRGELYKVDDRLEITYMYPNSYRYVSRPVLEKLPYSWENRNLYRPPEELMGGITGLIALKRVDTKDWFEITSDTPADG